MKRYFAACACLFALLVAAGCDEYQGYLCSPAIDAISFEELARGIGLAGTPAGGVPPVQRQLPLP